MFCCVYLQAWNCIWKQDKCCESAEESHCIYCPGKACKHLLQVLSWICFVFYNTALSCWFFWGQNLICFVLLTWLLFSMSFSWLSSALFDPRERPVDCALDFITCGKGKKP